MRVIAEVVKEYILHHDGLDFTVKGRITKIKGNDGVYTYEWSISHYYKPSEHAGGVHVPSSRSSISLKEAEDSLFAYMEAFTNIGIKQNNFY